MRSEGFPVPSGGFPVLSEAATPSGAAPPAGLFPGAEPEASPSGFMKRDPQIMSDLATDSAFAIPTASISVPASGAAMPIGLGGSEGSDAAFPVSGSGAAAVFAMPTGFGGSSGQFGGESGSAQTSGMRGRQGGFDGFGGPGGSGEARSSQPSGFNEGQRGFGSSLPSGFGGQQASGADFAIPTGLA